VRLIPQIIYGYEVSQDGTLDFSMEYGFFLSGTVSDPEDAPVFNADINVTDVATGEQVFTPGDQTDESGAYEVVVPGGIYDIDYRPQVGPPPYLACLRVENQNISDDVVIDVNVPYGVLLYGTVFDYNSQGVENVDVDAIDSSTGISVPLFRDHTDTLGAFATVLVADTYHLEFEPPSNRHLAAEKLYNYILNADSYVEVSLDSGMVVSGIVTFPDNSPMPDVKIEAVESSTQEKAFTPGNRTDQDGNYDITVKPNTYDLTYTPDPVYGYPDSTIYDVDIAGDMVIDVQFGELEPDTEPPTVTVISPDGGENWAVYSSQTVSWSASDNVGVLSVDIYYSVDGPNGTYLPISSGESNDGNYLWTVPATPTEDAWVKIVAFDAASNSGEDTSDGAFTIYLNPSECSYEPGDINHNGVPVELADVVSMIGIYRGTASPYYTCSCPPHGDNFAPEADPNGNCTASELSDVVTEIGAYRGTTTAIGCVDCPGQRRLAPDGSIGSPASTDAKNRTR
jgi:hypothetical protein